MNNSLQGLLGQLFRSNKNSIEILEKLSLLYQTTSDAVTINYIDDENVERNIIIPSYTFLISEIKRLNNNFENVSGVGIKKAGIKLSDGSYRTIFSNEIGVAPKSITVPKPITYKSKSNDLINSLIDPIPVISLDVTTIPKQISKVLIKKIVCNIESESQLQTFNNLSPLSYQELVTNLTSSGINFDEYDIQKSINPSQPKYSGSFDVLSQEKRTVTENGVTLDVFFYRLNKFTYIDTETGSEILLKIGDKLVVNSEIRDTVVDIVAANQNEFEIRIKYVEGYNPIITGQNKLIIHPSQRQSRFVDFEISPSQYLCLFFKPLTDDLVISDDWGTPTIFQTNDLVEMDTVVPIVEKEAEYTNLKANLLNLSKSKSTTIFNSLKPNPVVLDPNSFKVVNINQHLLSKATNDEIAQKIDSKNQLKSQISVIDANILELKARLLTNTDNIGTSKLIDEKYKEKEQVVNSFNTVVNEIVALTTPNADYKPKFRIRGYFPIPESKFLDSINKTGEQPPYNFKYRYRYLKIDGSTTDNDVFNFKDSNNANIKAVFPKWEEVITQPIQKQFSDGKVVVINQEFNNPDSTTVNQVDIPISNGERVEIQVQTLNEAGISSDWSQPIIIQFPEELNSELNKPLIQNQNEAVKADLLKELIAMGVEKHISDSVSVGDKTFSHFTTSIATLRTTPEGKPVDLHQDLQDKQLRIEKLEAIITGTKPKLKVSIFDENGKLVQVVNNNSQINIFAGYYKDAVSNLTVQKGAVVTKTYFIEIENLEAVDLELLSYVPGSESVALPIDDPLHPNFVSSYLGYIINKDEYKNYRKYWQVPYSNNVITNNPSLLLHHQQNQLPFLEIPEFQSGWFRGSWLYSRYYDFGLTKPLYKGIGNTNNLSVPNTNNQGSSRAFVWNETQTVNNVNGNGIESDFCVHIDHPLLQASSPFMVDFLNQYNGNKVPDSSLSPLRINYPAFVNSRFASLAATDTDGDLQLDYIPHLIQSSNADINGFAPKLGFTKADQFLIGKDTVGSYLFLSSNPTILSTGQITYNKGKIVQKNNNIRLMVVFQSRMTDYYGAGNTGTGLLGGLNSNAVSNLIHSKTIGIDIPIKGDDLFSFDINVEMQYQPQSVIL